MSAFINEISAALQDDLANREVWIEASVELVAQTEKSVVGKLLDQSSNAEKCENSANDRPILPTINRKNIDMNLSETENLASELPHGFSQINLDSKNKSVDSTDSVEVLDTECTGSSREGNLLKDGPIPSCVSHLESINDDERKDYQSLLQVPQTSSDCDSDVEVLEESEEDGMYSRVGNKSLFDGPYSSKLSNSRGHPFNLKAGNDNLIDDFLGRFVGATQILTSYAGFGRDDSLNQSLQQYADLEERRNPGLTAGVRGAGFSVPSQMFVPPSQVVELMAVFPSERSIKSIISEVTDGFFASSSIKRFSWAPCPKMTEIISDLGYSFAVESAYTSILDRFEKEKKIKKRLESQKKTTPKRCESDKETSDDENGSGSNKIADEKRSEQMNRLKISLNQVKQFNEPFNTQLDKQCSRCKFATDSVLVLAWHQSHPESVCGTGSQAKWICHICGEEFPLDSEIRSHYARQHQSSCVLERGNLKHECATCSASFPLKGSLVKHMAICRQNFLPNKHLAPVEADLLHINRLFWSLSQKQLREVQATMAARSSSNPKVGNIQTSRNALSTVPAKVHRIPGRIQSNKVRMQLPNSRSQSGGRIPTVPTYRPIRPLPTVSAQLTSAFGYTNIRGPPVLATTPLVAVRPKTFVFSGSPVVGTLIQSSTVAPRIQSAPKSFGQEVSTSTSVHGDRRKSVVNSKSLIGRLPKSFVSPKSNVFGRRAVRYNKINEQTQANKGETLSNTAVLEALLNAKKYPNVLKSPNKSQFDKTAARTIAKYNSITAKKPSSDSIKPFRLSGKFHGSLNSYLSPVKQHLVCEVCDFIPADYPAYLAHLQHLHQRCFDKSVKDLQAAPPLVCSRCSGRFHCYEGLERHLLMSHNLVTTDLLMKAQRKADSGRCQICTKVFAFNLLFHIANTHKRSLCSAEVMYSCDMCKRTFSQYGLLEEHLKVDHNRTGKTSGHAAFQPLSAADSKPQGQVAAFLSQFISGGKMSPPIGSVSAVTRGRPTLASRGNFGLSVMKPKCNKPNILQSSSQKPNPPSLPAAEKRKPNGPVELIVNPQPAKKMRYNCTPCALKFNAYSDVLQHWEVRHLKQLRVKLCRFDQCEICLSDLKKTCQIPYDMGQLLITIETPISPGGDDMLTKSVPEEIVLDDD